MDQMKIGAYLKELRKEKDLTQEQIAEKFGVSQRSVSRWENGYTEFLGDLFLSQILFFSEFFQISSYFHLIHFLYLLSMES